MSFSRHATILASLPLKIKAPNTALHVCAHGPYLRRSSRDFFSFVHRRIPFFPGGWKWRILDQVLNGLSEAENGLRSPWSLPLSILSGFNGHGGLPCVATRPTALRRRREDLRFKATHSLL